MENLYLSVVVPARRNAATIGRELAALDALLRSLLPSYEIILVIDGNEDQTLETVARTVHLPSLRVECFRDNQGKGHALRHGFSVARGDLVAFIDAGGDIDATELVRFLAAMVLYDADIVIGSKRHSLSHVTYPPLRRLYSSAYQLLVRLLFDLRVRDTQVGMKLFRRTVLRSILPCLLVKQFAFDLELLVAAHHLGFRRIVEAPVIIRHTFVSSIRLRAVAKTLWDTLAIWYRLRLRHWYDADRHAPAEGVVATDQARPATSSRDVPAGLPAVLAAHLVQRARTSR